MSRSASSVLPLPRPFPPRSPLPLPPLSPLPRPFPLPPSLPSSSAGSGATVGTGVATGSSAAGAGLAMGAAAGVSDRSNSGPSTLADQTTAATKTSAPSPRSAGKDAPTNPFDAAASATDGVPAPATAPRFVTGMTVVAAHGSPGATLAVPTMARRSTAMASASGYRWAGFATSARSTTCHVASDTASGRSGMRRRTGPFEHGG